jgi:arylsulfatase A-like enzyme
MSERPDEGLERASAYLRLGATCGLITGAASLTVLGLRHFLRGLIFYPMQTLWREPLAAVAFMTAVAAICALGRRAWPYWFRWTGLLCLELFIGGFSALLRVPSLYWGASAALAAGVAFQCTRVAARHVTVVRTLIRVILVPGLVGLVLAMGLVPGLSYWRDRRALRRFDLSAGKAPNVLLIVLDTVRAENLSAYGYSRPTTPVLAELAARGVLFSRAVSPAPWTLPAHASLFTGRWPHELSTDWMWPLDRTYPTLAEEFSSRGYLTAGFCANVHYCSYETGLTRGFAHYEDYSVPLRHALADGPLDQFIRIFAPPPDEDRDGKSRPAPIISETFLSWLDRSRDAGTGQPFFAFLNYFDAHRPYTSPEEFHARFSTPGAPYTPNLLPRSGPRRPWDANAIRGSEDAYDASIAYLDSEIGQLIGELRQRGLLEQTVIAITSDHGEEFGEHGVIGHGNSLYRSTLMVPLVIIAPGRAPENRRVDVPVSTRDLPRTLLDLAQRGAASRIPGRSLTRFWDGTPAGALDDVPVLSTLRYGPRLPDWYPVSRGPLRSVIDQGWHYIVQRDGEEELYDFDSDVLEEHNLAIDERGRPVAAKLRSLLDSLTADSKPRRP